MARFRKKFREDPHHLDITRLFPNLVTLVALCVGISGIRFALAERFEMAISCIVIAALLDAIDGRLARALNATSKFGGELDSLCDFINFGFTPSFIMYLWILHEVPALGWGGVLFFTICTAIRLARFNSDIIDTNQPPKPKPQWTGKFFTGIPSPAGALICVTPLMASFVLADPRFAHYNQYFGFFKDPIFDLALLLLVAVLMASRLPTYSLKKIFIRRSFISIFLMFFSLLVILAFIEPWLMVLFAGAVYAISIIFSIIHYIKLTSTTESNP